MVRRHASSIFVGRVDERAELEAALDATERGEAGLVLIVGEAGIGKSRLAAELSSRAANRGARVVSGHCFETSAVSLPFAPWIALLRELLGGTLPGTDPTHGVDTVELARLGLEIAVAHGREVPAPGDDRTKLFHAVLDLLRRAAMDRALVVLIEDLHWADASSLDLLRFVGAELSSESVLMIVTLRDEGSSQAPALRGAMAELARLPLVARLDLRPFDIREVAEQLTGIGGRRPTDDEVQRIFDRSDGNPFHVEELAGRPPDAGLPPTLAAVLDARLATLAPESRQLVLAAAAIGREVGHDLLARVADLPADRLLQGLREAVDKHVLVRAPASRATDFAFRHALIQEFAYVELLPAERTALHADIALALRDGGGEPGEIARHALLAGDLPLGFGESVEAADRAVHSLAFAEALAHVRQALDLWEKVDDAAARAGRDRPALLLLGARCAVAIGDWAEAVALRRAALQDIDPARRPERIAILLDLADSMVYAGDVSGSRAAAREAGELIPADPPSRERARVLAELANSELDEGRPEAARVLALEAIEVAKAAGAATEKVRALTTLALTDEVRLQYASAASTLRAAQQVTTEHGVTDEFVVATLVSRRTGIANSIGDFEGAIAMAEEGLARATRAGTISQQRPFLRWRLITAYVALGRWDDAELLVREARHDTTSMQYEWTIDLLLPVLIRRGSTEAAEHALRETDHGYDTPWQGAWVLQARIRVANGSGRWAAARAAADQAIELFPNEGEGMLLDHLPEAIRGEADWAEAARARRRTPEEVTARRVGLERLDRFRRIARQAIDEGGAGPLMEATLAMAEAEGSRLRGRSDGELWADAAGRAEALRQAWEAAYARFREAEAILGSRGDRRAALDLLRDAGRVAVELGARPLLDQVEGLARRGRLRLEPAGTRSRTRRATTDQGVVVTLTSREWEVLSLVAAGHTNREIGEALFISDKTASVHITNAMDKLGALSRYDAAASAARLGLLDRDVPAAHVADKAERRRT